ncbi:MAG: histone deacetylase [Desulfobacterales bacterium]|jgi:acetoin utilization deacetylase AcuC-like enzyme
MRKTGFLYDARFLLHETGPYHPEIPERLTAIYQGIEDGGLLPKLVRIKANPAQRQWIETVHDSAYIDRFGDTCFSGKRVFEHPDNQMCADTYDAAFLAVGGILQTIDMVMEGEIDNAFCAVRPPGHHAERDHALGFCYFNNVAVAARYLQQKWQIEKIGIIDFDVHHGNGTQHIFEQDSSVFYYSIHEHPTFSFPGTGREFEIGSGPGYGYTKNDPVLPGQGDAEYTTLVEENLVKDFERFQPGFVLVSAGFDGHKDDDMSNMNLTTEWYSWVMKRLMEIADRHCNGRIVSVLEGGYCLRRLPELARNHVATLLEE